MCLNKIWDDTFFAVTAVVVQPGRKAEVYHAALLFQVANHSQVMYFEFKQIICWSSLSAIVGLYLPARDKKCERAFVVKI